MNKVTLTYDQWYILFRPHIKFGWTSYDMVEITDETAIATFDVGRQIWTELDDGTIRSGKHFVNRVRYLACITPVPQDVEIEVVRE